MVPINLNLNVSGKRGGEKRAAPGEILLDAGFGIETYVAHPPATPPEKPKVAVAAVSGCESVAAKLGVQGVPNAPVASGGKT